MHKPIFFLIAFAALSNVDLCAELRYLPKQGENNIQQNIKDALREPGAVLFTPPKGWRAADPADLPKSVKAMVVGKGACEYPPSINLGTENYKGTLKQYLKRIKEINDSRGTAWKDLGTIRTEAGDASLSQADAKTGWGEVRMMHAILKKGDTIYILTASSLKDEFSKFYKDFFAALKSLRFSREDSQNQRLEKDDKNR